MKIPKPWTGKKSQTSPIKKAQHEGRAIKKSILTYIREIDRLQQIKEYNAGTEIQEQFRRDHLQD
jgi:hypothetical protein